MNMNKVLSAGFGLALIFGCATLTGASQDASSPSTPPPSAAPSSAGAAAPTGKPGRMNPDSPEEDAALNLTDDQKSKIAAIRADAKDQMKAINKDTTLSDTDRQTKLKELRKSTRAQVWAVLTPDQQKQWANEARARREEKRAAGSSTPQ
jgi:Spy/CpxP family protein refolding chaperone